MSFQLSMAMCLETNHSISSEPSSQRESFKTYNISRTNHLKIYRIINRASIISFSRTSLMKKECKMFMRPQASYILTIIKIWSQLAVHMAWEAIMRCSTSRSMCYNQSKWGLCISITTWEQRMITITIGSITSKKINVDQWITLFPTQLNRLM